jgi:hypothetical protein
MPGFFDVVGPLFAQFLADPKVRAAAQEAARELAAAHLGGGAGGILLGDGSAAAAPAPATKGSVIEQVVVFPLLKQVDEALAAAVEVEKQLAAAAAGGNERTAAQLGLAVHLGRVRGQLDSLTLIGHLVPQAHRSRFDAACEVRRKRAEALLRALR